jgi:hypothetical protein
MAGLEPEQLEGILRRFFQTPEGRQKVASAMRIPALRRWQGLQSVASTLWGESPEGSLELPFKHSSAYVLSDGGIRTADLPFYHGEKLEGETLLPRHLRLSEAWGEAQHSTTQTLIRWEHEILFKLLRQVPGKSPMIETRDLEKACDEAQERMEVRAFIMSVPELSKMGQLKSYEQFCSSYGGLRSYAGTYRNSSVLVSQDCEGMWAIAEGAGVFAADVTFGVLPDRITWEATLKMGVVYPSKISHIKVTT